MPRKPSPDDALFERVQITLRAAIAKRLRHVGADTRASQSAIVEAALAELFARPADEITGALKKHGAARRRKT